MANVDTQPLTDGSSSGGKSMPALAAERYSTTAIGLHWVMFVLIAGGFGIGLVMVDLPLSPAKLKFFSWHKWIGVTVFLLALIRVVWRLTHPAPPLPPYMTVGQRRAVGALHGLLYLLIVVTPFSGWLYSSATGVPTVYLGLVQLPDLVGKDQALSEVLKTLHHALTLTLAVLIVLHAGAALKHQFLDKDRLLARMWPGGRKRGGFV